MDLVRLKALGRYRNRDVYYQPGTVIELPADQAAFVLRDAPGCFEVVQPPVVENDEPDAKALDAPPQDKMVKRPPIKK